MELFTLHSDIFRGSAICSIGKALSCSQGCYLVLEYIKCSQFVLIPLDVAQIQVPFSKMSFELNDLTLQYNTYELV